MKFIFISGHAEKVIVEEGFPGADAEQYEIIMKPILPIKLLKNIRALMPTVSGHNASCDKFSA
ncbi:MAG: hypothetical protein ACOYL3_27745 [Desulfuromonadaceae bacterium]